MPTAFTPFSSRRPLIQGLLALLLGMAHAFTFAPWGNGWLQLAVLTGFALLVLRGGGFLTGLLFGIGWFSAGVGWVYISMHDYGGVPARWPRWPSCCFPPIWACTRRWAHCFADATTWPPGPSSSLFPVPSPWRSWPAVGC